MIQHGPVDIIVLTSREPRLDGSILHELEKQASTGTIRVLDAMILTKEPSGVRKTLDIEDLPPEESAKLGFIASGTRGLFDSYDTKKMFEEMAPGTVSITLAIEHTWSVALANAVAEKGIEVTWSSRMSAADVEKALAPVEKGDTKSDTESNIAK